jgi:3-phenylpropionate/cinnamic acid dioxygenase small subunit
MMASTANDTLDETPEVGGPSPEIIGTPMPQGERIRFGAAEYNEIADFLTEEAAMLDDVEYLKWFDMLHEELIYRMPVRVSRPINDGNQFAGDMCHFDEDKSTIMLKCRRLIMPYAWSENPSSRARRILGTIRVFRRDAPDEYDVTSSMVVVRYRRDMEIISGKRVDLICRSPEGFKLKRRTILSDQTTMLTQNLTIFL